MGYEINRRTFLGSLGALAAAGTPLRAAPEAPTAPVAVAKVKTYAEQAAAIEKMMDQLGGLGKIVKGKTVNIKINFTGEATSRLGYLPPSRSYWTHPETVGHMIRLIDKAGARRIRVCEGVNWGNSLEEWMYKASWDIRALQNAGNKVEFVQTGLPYPGKKPYTRFKVPNGGHLFPAYELNTVWAEADVLVSVTKVKEHTTAGVTIGMKNCFGITPCTIYGNGAGDLDEPLKAPRGGRQQILHNGRQQPAKIALAEIDPKSPRQDTYRIPRCVADMAAALPTQLTVIEGIETMAGGEGPWSADARPCAPGIMFAGTNGVTVDAVGMALMGFDPMAERGTAPFERCDSQLKLAEALGVGTRDLKRIEVVGTPIAEAKFDIRAVPGKRPRAGRGFGG